MSVELGTSQMSIKLMLKTTLLVLLLSMGLSACSSTEEILDAANPVNWFEGDETVPGSDQEYPNLGAVPDRPIEPEIKREYDELKSGLVADTAQAQYSDQVLRSQAVPNANLSLLQAKTLPDPQTPVEPPVASAIPTVTATGLTPSVNALAPTPAPTAEPLTQPSSSGQLALNPPASAAGLAGASTPSPDVMPNQNTNTTPAPAALIPKLIATIYFADGSASLTAADKSVVAQVFEIYKQGGKAIFITGHSSSPANAADQLQAGLINFKMSLNRANAVADAFNAHGIPKRNISVEARGSKNPRYVESNAAGIAGNRRAEIYIAK